VRQKARVPSSPIMATAKPYRVVIADDHPVVRRGIRTILQSQPGIEVCHEAVNGLEAVQLTKSSKPDLLVLDLTMPEMDGLDVVYKVREESPNTAVLVLTMHFSEDLAREVLRSGALAYVLKSDVDTDLLVAVDHVCNHQPYFTSQLSISMAHSFLHGLAKDSGGFARHQPHSSRNSGDPTSGGREKQQRGGQRSAHLHPHYRKPPQSHHAQDGVWKLQRPRALRRAQPPGRTLKPR
jgi:DNA-binding NarL/FixJ family response regulator